MPPGSRRPMVENMKGKLPMRYGTHVALLAAVLFVMPAARAHHAFSAEFDADQPIRLRGTVVKVEFINPHSWIHIEVTGEDGAKEVWQFEGGTPNTLFRRGVTRASLPVGTTIIVDGYQGRDGTNKASGRNITLPDGRQVFLDGSAPEEGPPPSN